MKKALLIFLFLCLMSPCALAEPGEASAAQRITFYHQDISEEALSLYPYNAIPCRSASFSVLGGNGCSLYAGLHAYQWLFGPFETMEDQVLHAQRMVYLLRGESPAVQSNGPYAAYEYAYNNGARKSIQIENKENSVMAFFDEKEGVLYLHPTWPKGGHYMIAVGYTHREIEGKNTLLLHVVDSSFGEVLSLFQGYDFETFAPITLTEKRHTAQEFWMPLQEDLHISFGLWLKPEGD